MLPDEVEHLDIRPVAEVRRPVAVKGGRDDVVDEGEPGIRGGAPVAKEVIQDTLVSAWDSLISLSIFNGE